MTNILDKTDLDLGSKTVKYGFTLGVLKYLVENEEVEPSSVALLAFTQLMDRSQMTPAEQLVYDAVKAYIAPTEPPIVYMKPVRE